MEKRETQWVGLIVAAFVVLATLFSLGPIFEGPDELEHYRFIRTLQRTLTLPNPVAQPYGEYHQAPLYYLLILPFAALLPDGDFAQIDGRLNPYHGFEFNLPGNDNKNLYVHTRAEAFPYSGSETARAVHGLRLLSVALGAANLVTGYAIFRLLWPDFIGRRLLALSLLAFWPQFVYLSSVVNNDTLAYALSSLALYVLLKQQRDGPSWRRAAILGLTLGAALLAKAYLAFLVFPIGLATVLERRTWRYALLTVALTAGFAGWWYVRNWVLLGDPTALGALRQSWPGEIIPASDVTLNTGLGRAVFAYQTLWARFGQGSVAVADAVYHFFDLLLVSATAGLLIFAIRRRWGGANRLALLHSLTVAAWGLVWVGMVIYYASRILSGNQGRFLMPGVAVWAALLAFGLSVWIKPRWMIRAALASALVLAGICLVCLFGYFFPSYRALPVPDSIPHALNIRYGDAAELLGMSPAEFQGSPGETLTMELYWRALQPASPTLQTYVHAAFASDVVWRDSLPGNGHRPADDWLPGETWAERYTLHIPADALPGTTYLLTAGLYDPARESELPPTDSSGQPLGPAPVIAQFTVTEKAP